MCGGDKDVLESGKVDSYKASGTPNSTDPTKGHNGKPYGVPNCKKMH